MRLLYRTHDSSVSAFLPVTPAAQHALIDTLGIPERKVIQVTLGVDVSAFAPNQEGRMWARGQLGLSDSDRVILTAGKVAGDKRLEFLIDAFAHVRRAEVNVRLVIAGNGNSRYLQSLQRLTVERGVEDSVLFTGFIPHDRLPGLYNSADVGVWPGAHSITVLEALATALPCVLPAAEPAYREVIESDACVTFQANSSSDLARCLRQLIVDRTLRTSISTRARRFAEERLSWNVVARRILALYESSLMGRG